MLAVSLILSLSLTACGKAGGPDGPDNSGTWTQGTDFSFKTNGIAFGNGKFVVVGASGKMAYSTYGKTWTAVSNSTFGNSSISSIIYDGAAGQQKFIAIGSSQKMASSTDGINWASVNISSAVADGSVLSTIAYGKNGKWVLGGSSSASGLIVYSSDGVNWTEVSAANNTFTGSGSQIYGIAYGDNKFVAVGGKGSYNYGVAYSNDCTSWTAVTADAAFKDDNGNPRLSSVAYGGGTFVALSGVKAAYSSDGLTWTPTNGLSGGGQVFYVNGKFVATVSAITIRYSTDGITWTGSTKPINSVWAIE